MASGSWGCRGVARTAWTWLWLGTWCLAGAEITCRACWSAAPSPASFRVQLLQEPPPPLEVPRGVSLGPSGGDGDGDGEGDDGGDLLPEHPARGWGAGAEEDEAASPEESPGRLGKGQPEDEGIAGLGPGLS
ncbi:hypothetical protein JRQ81_018199, partial [Phrynocephalus forsythii]